MRVPEPSLPEFSREHQVAVYSSFDEESKSRKSSAHLSDKPTNIQIRNGRRLFSKHMQTSTSIKNFGRKRSEGNSDHSDLSLWFPLSNPGIDILHSE